MASLFYQFTSSNQFETLDFTFENELEVSKAKNLIMNKHFSDKRTKLDFELLLYNAQDNKEYKNGEKIKKNSYIFVKRIPVDNKSENKIRVIEKVEKENTHDNTVLEIDIFGDELFPKEKFSSGVKSREKNSIKKEEKKETLFLNKIEKKKHLKNNKKIILNSMSCKICNQVMEKSILLSCCGDSFCDQCTRNITKCKSCNSNKFTKIPNKNFNKLICL
jgi:hypothetical protein